MFQRVIRSRGKFSGCEGVLFQNYYSLVVIRKSCLWLAKRMRARRKYIRAIWLISPFHVPVNSKTAYPHPPPSPHPLTRACPGHLTGVLLRTVGNSTQNEARPVGHLILLSKRWSASQAKGFRNSSKKPVKCGLSEVKNFIKMENLRKTDLRDFR